MRREKDGRVSERGDKRSEYILVGDVYVKLCSFFSTFLQPRQRRAHS